MARAILILAIAIQAEAPDLLGSHQDTAAEAIRWVVRNRVANPWFPDTIEAVLAQPGQFPPFLEGMAEPLEEWAIVSAEQVLVGNTDPTHGALFFYSQHDLQRLGWEDKGSYASLVVAKAPYALYFFGRYPYDIECTKERSELWKTMML